MLRLLQGDAFIEDVLTGLPFGPSGIVLLVLLLAFLFGFFLGRRDHLDLSCC